MKSGAPETVESTFTFSATSNWSVPRGWASRLDLDLDLGLALGELALLDGDVFEGQVADELVEDLHPRLGRLGRGGAVGLVGHDGSLPLNRTGV